MSGSDTPGESGEGSVGPQRLAPEVYLAPHPLLDVGLFATAFSRPLGELGEPLALASLLRPGPLDGWPVPDAALRKAVRDLFRQAGFKPTGRSKPASEYVARAVERGALAPINAAVCACNVVSLHSGLPISIVCLDRARPPFSIGAAPPGTRYVFNRSGQEIDLGKLLCLFDADGPCANAVKDSERTKTRPETTCTLTVVWGTRALPGRTARAVAWYRALLEAEGARTTLVTPRAPGAG